MDAQCAMGCLIEDPKPWKIPLENPMEKHNQRSRPSEWTLFKITFLYV
jgi:hypothetical protein